MAAGQWLSCGRLCGAGVAEGGFGEIGKDDYGCFGGICGRHAFGKSYFGFYVVGQ
jgi:hypothetical protein